MRLFLIPMQKSTFLHGNHPAARCSAEGLISCDTETPSQLLPEHPLKAREGDYLSSTILLLRQLLTFHPRLEPTERRNLPAAAPRRASSRIKALLHILGVVRVSKKQGNLIS